jgi:hypothetical protein
MEALRKTALKAMCSRSIKPGCLHPRNGDDQVESFKCGCCACSLGCWELDCCSESLRMWTRALLPILSGAVGCFCIKIPTVPLRNGVEIPLIGMGSWEYNSSVAEESYRTSLRVGRGNI